VRAPELTPETRAVVSHPPHGAEPRSTQETLLGLYQAVESTRDAICMVDLAGQSIYQNRAFSDLFGFTTDELNAAGGPWALCRPAEPREAIAARLAAGRAWREEVEISTRRGAAVAIALRADAVLGDDGRPIGAVLVATDVTERKRVEEERRRHQAELAHALRVSSLGELAAGLAHELNQPIAAIASYADGCALRIRSLPDRGDELGPVIEKISAEALRAGEITRRLREFLCKTEPRREAVDLNDLVRDAVELASIEARRRGIVVRCDLARALRPVLADRIQVEQVILNLLLNGLEAMDGCRSRDELTVKTSLSPQRAASVAVRDHGRGLPATIADRVFEPFVTTKPGGLGMGLSIGRSIVESHGGRIWAAPHPEGGTIVTFQLPAARGEAREPAR
jgi:PAS domain S-box-containing protein